MDFLERQNRSQFMQRLTTLLRDTRVPLKSESEWNAIEESLFNRLAQGNSAPVVLRREYMFRSFSWSAVAAAACFIAAISTYIISTVLLPHPSQILAGAAVLDMQGTVKFSDAKGAEVPMDALEPSAYQLFRGGTLETGADGEMAVQLAEGTGFKLSAESRIEILQADKHGIRVALHYGDMLFSVRKQRKGCEFVVITPNAECKVIGTIFQVRVNRMEKISDLRTELAVFQGTVSISDRLRYDVCSSVEAGFMTSLADHRFDNESPSPASAQTLRDISILKLALELAHDSLAAPQGVVEFGSEPSEACVAINGRMLGTTPMVMKFPAGVFELEISHEGFEPWRGDVMVNNRRTSSVMARLAPQQPRSHKRKSQPAAPAWQEAAEPVEQNEDMPEGFVNHPGYVEALIQITIGEYRKALDILEQLRQYPELSIRDRAYILKQISLCYRSLGNFNQALRELKRRYRRSEDQKEKSRLLWEIATIQTTCLGDLKEGEKTLHEYLKTNPHGQWAEDARERLAEMHCLIQGQ